ncbi:MAG: hypothetical protein U0P30_05875 [Vicinamibacterales bacterium]
MPLGVKNAVASGALDVTADGSYRIAFVDDDGVEMPDDTEYFIRTLLDRPPDVRVERPAGDRQVTPLEEVAIEARADDDFGVQSFDLVLQKPGQTEVQVPLGRGGAGQLTLNGRHTLFLEDLEVAPGDIVSYYVRARDVGRGKPSSESRSDIYFLEVKAFNDEFVAAQSRRSRPAAGRRACGISRPRRRLVVATTEARQPRPQGAGGRIGGRHPDAGRRAAPRAACRGSGIAVEGRRRERAGSASPPSRGRHAQYGGRGSAELAIEAMRRAIELD